MCATKKMSALEDVIAISVNATNYCNELLQRTTATLNWLNDPNKLQRVIIESVDSKKRATSHNVNSTQVCQLVQMTPQTTLTSQIEASSTPK